MSRVFEVDPSRPDGAMEALAAAEAALEAGDLVAFPTDTVYGLGCRPDDPAATGRLFAAKRRPAGLTLPVLVASADQAFDLVVPDERAVRLAQAFWPGPLTVVLPRGILSQTWQLGDAAQSIGVRVPNHPLALALLQRTGPLAVTSANISGHEPIGEGGLLQQVFGDMVAVYLVASEGSGPARPSTVVDLTGRELVVHREGPIAPGAILVAAGQLGGMAS
jgi:tRNA threonylcarbamoyl adenosine modification protein (Sua5/YciO/YrdC/YwlC family)